MPELRNVIRYFVFMVMATAGVGHAQDLAIHQVQVQPTRVPPGGTIIVLVNYGVPGASTDSPVLLTETRRIISGDGTELAVSKVEKQVTSEQVQSILPVWIPPTSPGGAAKVEVFVVAEGGSESSMEKELTILGSEPTEGLAPQEEVPAVDPKLAQLEQAAEIAFSNYQYVAPKGDNVLEYVEQMLKLDPVNETAMKRKKNLGDHFLELGEKAAKEGRYEDAVQNFKLFLKVFPEDDYGRSVLKKAEVQRLEMAEETAEAERLAALERAKRYAWEQATAKNSIDAYQRFVDAYPQSPHSKDAFTRIIELRKERENQNLELVKREKEALLAARDEDTMEGWTRFLTDFPDSPSASYAQGRIQQLEKESKAFSEARSGNTLESYEAFLARFPKSPQAGEAHVRLAELRRQAEEARIASLETEKNAFLRASQERSVAVCEAFLNDYPESDYAPMIRSLLREAREAEEKASASQAYERAFEAGSIEALRAFVGAHPESDLATEAELKIQEMEKAEAAKRDEEAWLRAKKTDTVKGYEGYLNDFPIGAHTRSANRRIDELKKILSRKRYDAQLQKDWRRVRAAHTVSDYKRFLKKYPKGRYASQARTRVKQLERQAEIEAKNRHFVGAMEGRDLKKLKDWVQKYPKDPRARQARKLILKLEEAVERESHGPMVRVPAGEFKYWVKKEIIYLPEYWIDKYPVTNAQYKRFLEENPNVPPPKYWNGAAIPPGKEKHPVVWVSHSNALAYARWAGKRLPTRREWEKGCRGTDYRIYPWGNEWDKEKANTKVANSRGTTSVNLFEAAGNISPYGAVDCVGNVWEWTSEMRNDKKAWAKGGSWRSTKKDARLDSRRDFSVQTDGGDDRGFRCIWESNRP